MDAVKFMKKWRDLCASHECNNECPMYYDYCPMDGVFGDRDETIESVVDYVKKTQIKGGAANG